MIVILTFITTFCKVQVFVSKRFIWKKECKKVLLSIFYIPIEPKVETISLYKDYFDDWDKVEQIRNNTIFLYVALLCTIDMDFVPGELWGILNQQYEFIFMALDADKGNRYDVELDDVMYSDARVMPRNKGLIFDKNGLVKNTITFEYFDFDEYKTFEISRDNMPISISISCSCSMGNSNKLL